MNNESSDFTQQLSQCYFVLSDPTADTQKINQVSSFLMNFYSQPNAFKIIVDYISLVDNPVLQKGAVVGIKMILQANPALLQNPETYISLLNLSIMQTPFIRKFAIFYLSQFISQQTVGMIIQFIESIFASNTINDIQTDTCMKLLTIVLNIIPEENAMQYIELCSNLSSKAFQTSNIDLIISAAIFRLVFIPFLQDDQNPIYQEYMNSSFQTFIQVVQQRIESDQVDELANAISKFILDNPYSINYQPLLELVIKYTLSIEISQTLAIQLFFISDSILKACQDIIKNQPNVFEIMNQLLNSYCLYSKRTYIPNNSYELSNYFTFTTFFKVFYEDQFLTQVYSNIPPLFNEGPAGKFTTLLILHSSFDFSNDFYISKESELYTLFQTALTDKDFCVRSTASFVLSHFCQAIRPSIEFDTIIPSLFNCITTNPSIEFLTTLTDIFEVSSQTDTIFDQSITFLFSLLEASSDVIVRQRVVICISSLTKHSRERVCAFFGQIFTIMSQILSLSSDERNSVLVVPAISCLSHLCESCTKEIESYIPSFLNSVMANLNDLSSQFECINAISSICVNFPQQARSIVVQLLKTLFEIANAQVDFDEFQGSCDAGDDDDDFFEFQDEINANAAAVRVICKVCSIYPELLAQSFNDVYAILMKFRDSMSGDGTVACAKGVTFIAEALMKLQGSELQAAKIIDDLIVPLIKGMDPVTSGNGFFALSILIAKSPSFVNEKVTNAVLMALTGQLFFQRERVTYNKCLFDGIYKLLRSIMKMNFFNALQQYIPIIQQFLQSKSCGLRDFSLRFFAELIKISKNPQILSNEVISGIIQFSMTVVDGFASIDFLTKFIEIAPNSVSAVLPKIMDLVKSRISDNRNVIVVEKCILLLMTLLQKLNADISLFVPIILQSTPPKILLRKTDRFFQLIQWIIQNNNGSLNQQIAAAIIRLFSESDNLLRKRNLSNEQFLQIKAMIQSLAPTIPNFNDFCAKICNNDAFKLSNLNNHAFK